MCVCVRDVVIVVFAFVCMRGCVCGHVCVCMCVCLSERVWMCADCVYMRLRARVCVPVCVFV